MLYMSLAVKFWGVRGSLPSTMVPMDWKLHIEGLFRGFFSAGFRDVSQIGKYLDSLSLNQVAGYGVATTCVEVSSPKTSIILDGGSGIRSLSEYIMGGTRGRGKGHFHIYMTHFHLDHILGLPFFSPHFVPGNTIHYYAVQDDLERVIRGVFSKPIFPVTFESLPAKIVFHKLEPRKPYQIEDITITPYKLDHPDPCWGAKIQSGGSCYAHCVDTEGTRVSREELEEDLPLYQGVDLMCFDAQYTFPELAEKANWGHSASQVGMELGFREGIKKILFAHHDPGATIQQIMDLKRQTKEYYDFRMERAQKTGETLPSIDWDFVHEGLEVSI